MRRRFVLLAVVALVAAVIPIGTASADGVHPGLTPDMVEENVAVGGHFDVEKTVHTPEIPPKADVYFLVDTTGSMGSVIDQIKTDIGLIIAGIQGPAPNARFGLGEYKDFPFDPFAFNHRVVLGPDDGLGGVYDVSDDVLGLAAGGGADGSEGQFFALDQLAEAGNPGGFDPTTASIVVWIGDAPAHDAVCAAISPLAYDITEASVTAKLVAPVWGGNGLTAVAISTTTGFALGLDDNPTLSASNYVPPCVIGGAAGQATNIAAATGGTHLTNVPPAQIAQAIIDAIGDVEIEVSMTSNCDGPITTDFSDPVTVTSGDDAVFTESIWVEEGTEPGDYHCEDWALIDGQPMTDEEGATIYEEKWITVVAATCDPTENPHGNQNPKAPANGGQAQNQDGFYEVGSTLEGEAVFVLDDGSGTVFGPFADGTEIKYTEDGDAIPSSQAMGANNGAGNNGSNQGNDTDFHIIGNGDAMVIYVDGFGNTTATACLVPPPPK